VIGVNEPSQHAARAPGGTLAAPPGDPAAGPERLDLAALFRRHHLELVRLALLLVGDQPTAEDVVQDVFARLQARDRRLAGRDDGGLAYARTAVVNACRSVLRHRSTVYRASAALPPPGVQDSAEGQALLAEDRRQVLAALSKLPPRRREVLVLRYYLGLSEAEIAATLGISAGAVKSSAARGLAALARQIGEKP
jgi:RNA polymerase sigma-70 factor (sigma-E family)